MCVGFSVAPLTKGPGFAYLLSNRSLNSSGLILLPLWSSPPILLSVNVSCGWLPLLSFFIFWFLALFKHGDLTILRMRLSSSASSSCFSPFSGSRRSFLFSSSMIDITALATESITILSLMYILFS